MRKRLTTEEFIKRARELHGDRYNYDKVVFVNSRTKVIIGCYIHGDFEQLPGNHLNIKNPAGCLKCSNEARKLTTEEFIKRAIELHGDKYNYDKVIYRGTYKKVIIGCSIHGDFEQRPDLHIDKSNPGGCQKCASEVRRLCGGWSYRSWVKSANSSKNFDSFKVYIASINNKFYKIGKTYRKLSRRFSTIPLDCKLIKVIEFDDGIEASLFEKELHQLCSEYKQVSEVEFCGMYECFSSIDPIKELIGLT